MKKFVLLAVLFSATVFAQNYNFPVGLYNYETFEEGTTKQNLASTDSKVLKNDINVVLRKSDYGVLINYLGSCSSLSLFDKNGNQIENAEYYEDHRGIMMLKQPKDRNKTFFLRVERGDKVFFHKVNL